MHNSVADYRKSMLGVQTATTAHAELVSCAQSCTASPVVLAIQLHSLYQHIFIIPTAMQSAIVWHPLMHTGLEHQPLFRLACYCSTHPKQITSTR